MGTSGAQPGGATPLNLRAVGVTVPISLPGSFNLSASWDGSPMPVDGYLTYLDLTSLLGIGSAVVLGTPLKAGCTVRVTITTLLAVAVQIIVVGWT